ECLSVFGLHPVAFIRLAGDLGCSHVTLNLSASANRLPVYPEVSFRHDSALQREMTQAARDCGVAIGMIEGFAITPDIAAADYARDLDMVAELGAKAICSVSLEKDMARSHAEFARIAEMAAERGLVATTEVGAGVLRRLDKAVAAV